MQETKKFFGLTVLQRVCIGIAGMCFLGGGMGMLFSFAFMATTSMENITAGVAGFIAGSVLVASSLLSLAIISVNLARGRE